MRLIFLFLFGLGLIPLIECQNSCSRNQECVPAQSCESFVEENKKLEELRGTSGFKAQLLKLKSLVCNKAERKVCCDGTDSNKDCDDTDEDSPCYRPSLEEERCGLEGEHSGFIIGGEDTRIGQFPFVALLGKATRRNPGKNTWYCGGTLINKWYVLTAAHCETDVEYVRLGDWKVVDADHYTNTTDYEEDGAGKCYYYNEVSKRECQRNRRKCTRCQKLDETIDCSASKNGRFELCSEPVQVSLNCKVRKYYLLILKDIPVAEFKVHPGYRRTVKGSATNDIMLIKLSRPAEFNQFVKPVCLPS